MNLTKEDEARSVVTMARLLWILVTIVVTGVVGVWRVAWVVSDEVNKIDERLSKIESQAGDRYTLTMASENAMREAIANPGHRVPDPRNAGMYIQVRESEISSGTNSELRNATP